MSDVDRFVGEAEGEGHVFIFRDKAYDLAPKLPALVVIKASRFRRSGTDENDPVAGDLMFDMLDEVFGQETLDLIVKDHHLGVEQLGDLLTAAVRSYGIGDDEGNRPARRAAARGGRSTSPTRGRK